jgi:hypothetical protein
MTTAYDQGFIDKCATAGVDPNDLFRRKKDVSRLGSYASSAVGLGPIYAAIKAKQSRGGSAYMGSAGREIGYGLGGGAVGAGAGAGTGALASLIAALLSKGKIHIGEGAAMGGGLGGLLGGTLAAGEGTYRTAKKWAAHKQAGMPSMEAADNITKKVIAALKGYGRNVSGSRVRGIEREIPIRQAGGDDAAAQIKSLPGAKADRADARGITGAAVTGGAAGGVLGNSIQKKHEDEQHPIKSRFEALSKRI